MASTLARIGEPFSFDSGKDPPHVDLSADAEILTPNPVEPAPLDPPADPENLYMLDVVEILSDLELSTSPETPSVRELTEVSPALDETPKPLRCAVCSKPCALECAKCYTPYCSKECQKLEWPYHKHLCDQVDGFLESQTGDHDFIGLYFPVQSFHPELVWLSQNDNGELVRQVVDVLPNQEPKFRFEAVFGDDFPEEGWHSITDGQGSELEMDHIIMAYWRADFLSDGSLPNLAVRGWMDWKHRHDWRGPILFAAENMNGRAVHISLADLKIIRDFLRSTGDRHAGLISPIWTFGRHGYPETAGWIQKVKEMVCQPVETLKLFVVTRSEETIDEKSVEVQQAAEVAQTEFDRCPGSAKEAVKDYVERKSTQSDRNEGCNSAERLEAAGDGKVNMSDTNPLTVQEEAEENILSESESPKCELTEEPIQSNPVSQLHPAIAAEGGSIKPLSIVVGGKEKPAKYLLATKHVSSKYIEKPKYGPPIPAKIDHNGRLIIGEGIDGEMDYLCMFLGVERESLKHILSAVNPKRGDLEILLPIIRERAESYRREIEESSLKEVDPIGENPVENESAAERDDVHHIRSLFNNKEEQIKNLLSAIVDDMEEKAFKEILEVAITTARSTAEQFWSNLGAEKGTSDYLQSASCAEKISTKNLLSAMDENRECIEKLCDGRDVKIDGESKYTRPR